MRKSPTISFVSLGCVKNLVESEVMLGRLAQDDFIVCAEPEGCDVIVINTCGFLRAAEEEAMEHIRRAVEMKRKGSVGKVIVAGCLPQRHGPDFAGRLDGVDAVMGLTAPEEVSRVARVLLSKRGKGRIERNMVGPDPRKLGSDRGRFRLTPRHTAYLRISEGCDHTCSFCTIPQIRGPFRSKPMDLVVEEAEELAADGALELNLIAQDTSSYGLDTHRKIQTDRLLARLGEIDGVRWLRLLYMYPTSVNDRLIAEMARNPKVVPYIDLPIQHTRERVLRLMRRGVTETGQKDLIHRLREGIPGLVLRTTVIVGFPQETEEDFEGLLEDLRDLRFDRLGAFEFSREPGTAADELGGRLPEEVVRKRFELVMEQQRRIAFEIARSWIGREVEAVLERRIEKEVWEGRTYGDALEIDPVIRVYGKGEAGEIRKVRVTASEGYDLIGKIVRSP